MSALFVADSFTVTRGTKTILKSASLWADAGRVTVILGRNGSGKSTLLRAMLGQIAKDVGHVHFDGVHYENPRLHRLARAGLYYLPDHGVLSPGQRCDRQIGFLRRRFGCARFEEFARSFDVDRDLDRRPRQLSGGERARLEIALALAREPRCLVADEAMVGITPKDRPRVIEGLRELARAGAAVVLTGHDVVDLLDAADRVVWMVGGTTHSLGTAGEARSNDAFRRDYLGTSP